MSGWKLSDDAQEEVTDYQKGIEFCIDFIKRKIARHEYIELSGVGNERLIAPIRKDELQTVLDFLATEKYS